MKRIFAFLLLLLPGTILPLIADSRVDQQCTRGRISSVLNSSAHNGQLADPQDDVNHFATPSTDQQFRSQEKSKNKFRMLKRGYSTSACTPRFLCATVNQSLSPDSGPDMRLHLFCIMRC